MKQLTLPESKLTLLYFESVCSFNWIEWLVNYWFIPIEVILTFPIFLQASYDQLLHNVHLFIMNCDSMLHYFEFFLSACWNLLFVNFQFILRTDMKRSLLVVGQMWNFSSTIWNQFDQPCCEKDMWMIIEFAYFHEVALYNLKRNLRLCG